MTAFALDLDDVVSIIEMAHVPLINISYSGYTTAAKHNITAIDWSDAADCAVVSESVLAIQNAITDASFTTVTQALTDTHVVITVYVTGGTDVKVTIDLGDASISSER